MASLSLRAISAIRLGGGFSGTQGGLCWSLFSEACVCVCTTGVANHHHSPQILIIHICNQMQHFTSGSQFTDGGCVNKTDECLHWESAVCSQPCRRVFPQGRLTLFPWIWNHRLPRVPAESCVIASIYFFFLDDSETSEYVFDVYYRKANTLLSLWKLIF